MKKYFAKENFIFSTLDKKTKIQTLIIYILIGVFFLFSGFTFFNALYAFLDIIGSIVSGSPDVAINDLIRSLPIILSAFMSIWALLLMHGTYRFENDEKRHKSQFKNAIALICFAGFNILYILILRFTGKFLSLVEGSPSTLYPLDAILYSLLFLAIGIFTLIYLKKLEDKWKFLLPAKGPLVKKGRFIYCLGVSIWMLVAIYSVAAFFIGLFIIDFQHGHQFYSISLLLSFLLGFIYLAIWEFYFNDLKIEKRKEFLLPIGIAGICLSIIVLILYFVSLGIDLYAPSNIGFGILPVAFTASVNIATLVVVFTPFIVSLIALIKGLIYKKQQNNIQSNE